MAFILLVRFTQGAQRQIWEESHTVLGCTFDRIDTVFCLEMCRRILRIMHA